MNVSGVNVANILATLPDQAGAGGLKAEVGVRMLKKAQDQMTQEGEAMVRMIEDAGPAKPSQGLDAYA